MQTPLTIKLNRIPVPPQQSGQKTAYLLGYFHGSQKARAWRLARFVYTPTRTAYALGLAAGLAWRAMQKGA